MEASEEPVIDMSGVCLRRSGREILRGVDWRMERGQHWAVVGANGSGKTTLLQIASGVLFPSAGSVSVLGGRFGACDLFRLRRRVGWVGAAPQARMPATDSVRDIVASGLAATFGRVRDYDREDAALAEAAIGRVGMAGRSECAFGVLSQGERQKVVLARAMAASPDLYILDEVCSGLDVAARESFLRAVADIARAGRAGVVMVTHHIEEIPPVITHALVLKEGRVLAAGPAGDMLVSEILSDAFGLPLTAERRDGRFRLWAR